MSGQITTQTRFHITPFQPLSLQVNILIILISPPTFQVESFRWRGEETLCGGGGQTEAAAPEGARRWGRLTYCNLRVQEYPDYKYRPRKKMKGSPGCPLSGQGPLSPTSRTPKTRPGCLKPRFGVRPGRLGQNNNMTGTSTSTILHHKTVMTAGVQVLSACNAQPRVIAVALWNWVTIDHDGSLGYRLIFISQLNCTFWR